MSSMEDQPSIRSYIILGYAKVTYVLSPNLFKIFINDLPDYLQSSHDPVQLHNLNLHCLMYADDVIILSEWLFPVNWK